MSQLNLLSVDVAKVSSNQGDIANKQGNKSTTETEFSAVIDRHYQAQKFDSGEKQSKNNGNHEPQAANHTEQKESLADKALVNEKNGNDKTPSDEHTLPVAVDVEAITQPSEKTVDAHVLPVIASPQASEVSSTTNKVDAAKQKLVTNESVLKEVTQVSKTAGAAQQNDDAVDLLNMLNGAQKFIAKTSSENVTDKNINLENGNKVKVSGELAVNKTEGKDKLSTNEMSVLTTSHENVASTSEIKDKNFKSGNVSPKIGLDTEQLNSQKAENNIQVSDKVTESQTTAKTTVTDKLASELATDTTLKEKLLQKPNNEIPPKRGENSALTSDKEQAMQQSVKQNAEQVEGSQNSSKEFENESVNLTGSNSEKNNLAVSKQPLEDALANKGNVDKKEFSNAGNVSAQANANNQTLETASAPQHEVVKEPVTSRTVNQSTASVVAASIKEQSASAANNGSSAEENGDKSGKNSDKTVDEVAIAKSGIDKNSTAVDKAASMVNQTLDANAGRSSLNAVELSMQHEKSFESTISQLSTNAVQTQKSITALNTETIAIYRKDFANAVKDKVMVMINQKIQQVEIQLDPPEMGNVHVRVNLQNEQAAVQFIVQNQHAKDALEQNMGKLRDMLSENGVDVGDANIEQRQPGEQSETAFSDDKNGQQNGNGSEQITDESHTQVHNVVKASSTGVDYYA